jgi:hypothetical protein
MSIFNSRTRQLAMGAICAAGLGLTALPAHADWHDHGDGDRGGYERGDHDHYDRDWHRHGFYDGYHEWHWYAGFGPDYGYYGPPPGYYAPPPVYYAPPPAYYYAPPVITFGFRP